MKKSKLFNIFLIFSLILLSSCYFTKALKYKEYKLDDLSDFPAAKFAKPKNSYEFCLSSLPIKEKLDIDSMLIGSNRYAFLIIRNDSILYEFYNDKITDTSLLPSFSVAKSFVSTLVQIAYQERKINSLNDPITLYLPTLRTEDERFSKITIQHLLDMRSGIHSSENYYNPTSDVLRMGFGRNVAKKALHTSIESEPNKKFEYKSINTQLLSLIIEKATKKKLQAYFYEKLYLPLRMQHPATWIVDDKSHMEVRAFCCLNMTALDYAKFGKLYLDNGMFEGKKILNDEWVKMTSNPDTMKNSDGYKNQFWQWDYKKKVYYARGLLNQYIILSPEKNLMIIHFGNSMNPNHPLKNGLKEKMETWL